MVNERPDFKKLFSVEHLATLATVSGIVCLSGSIAYNFAYLSGAGLTPAQVDLSAADIWRTAIISAPIVLGSLIGMIIGIGLSNVLAPNQHVGTAAPEPVSHVEIQPPGKIDILGYVIRFSYILVIVLYAVTGREIMFILAAIAAVLAIHDIISTFVYSRRMGWNKFDFEKRLGLQIVLLVVSLGSYGIIQSNIDLRVGGKTSLEFDGQTITGQVMRTFESGYLISADKIYFIPKDKVTRITYEKPSLKKVGIPCYAWKVLCFERQSLK